MESEDILELLRLKKWSRERLAVEMDVSVAAVHAWVRQGGSPAGPASVLMRIWLREARGEIQIIEVTTGGGSGKKKREPAAVAG